MMDNAVSSSSPGPVDATQSPFVQCYTLPFSSVQLTNGFWAERQTLNRQVSLRHGYEMLEKAGNFHNFRLASGLEGGQFRGRNFYDEDVYKWLEAIGWELGNAPDSDLSQMAEDIITLIAAAQQTDGYLDTYFQVAEPEARWTDMDHGHEAYCAGHLIQAAVAFRRSIDDRRLMEVACGFADHMCTIFGPGKRSWAPGHPEVEMALVELYRETGVPRYLELAQFFIDQRGQNKMVGWGPYGPEYHQDHVPIRQANEAAGHAVRQLYLTTGVTDIYMQTGEVALLDALERLWDDIHTSKMYITGGVGSRYDGESFGEPYELPNDQCYCETCAAIGDVMWNWRLLLLTGDGRFADVIERALYNGILSSPALDGKHYFYVNPLMLRGGRYVRLSTNPPEGEQIVGRPEWHEVACCPPNVMRVLSSLAHYFATFNADGITIHQYGSAEIKIEIPEIGLITLRMDTDYPWKGKVSMVILQTPDTPWQLRLRQPGWSQSARISINHQPIPVQKDQKGYYSLERRWLPGDQIELDISLVPVLIESNPRIDATRDCLAIQYGPLVYCLESHDQEEEIDLLDVEIIDNEPLQAEWQPDLLGGIMLVKASGYTGAPQSWGRNLYRSLSTGKEPLRYKIRLTAIPYYAWGNRGLISMRVWIPRARVD